jgi:general L-amino acid transport system substrate-binding protein
MKRVLFALIAAAGLAAVSPANAALLDQVKSKGFVQCGVSQGLPGFSNRDDKGNWTGLDVDVCRAIAAAIFDDATKVRYTPLTAKDRFTALQSGEIDVLSRNTTWTLSRDTSLGLNFAGVNYYDGQGFLIRKDNRFALQVAARSSSRNSARPRRVSRCLRVSHERSDGTR